MACVPCSKKRQQPMVGTINYSNTTEQSIQTPQEILENGKNLDFDCTVQLESLRLLRIKIKDLFNKFKTEPNKSYGYNEKDKIVRNWMLHIRQGCPPEDQLRDIQNEIGADYKKYF